MYNPNITKTINLTVVTFDTYEDESYQSHQTHAYRKLNLINAKRLAREISNDKVIIETIKLEHYKQTYEITIDKFVKIAKLIKG